MNNYIFTFLLHKNVPLLCAIGLEVLGQMLPDPVTSE
jgi:hypothetical protein